MAKLFARVHDKASNTYPWVPVEFSPKNGRPIEVKDATSYFIRLTLDGQRKIKKAGKTLEQAVVELNKWKAAEDGSIAPVQVAQFEASDRKRLGTLVAEFQAEQATLGKAPATIVAYTKPLDNFLEFCQKPYADQISRKDILNFILWMRANVPKRRMGDQNSTLRNYLIRIRAFLLWAGVKEFPLPQSEWPVATEKNPEKYSIEVVNKMLEAATEDEKDLITFLLYSGFRKAEVAHCKYSDINFQAGTVNVSDKPEFAWTIKNRKQRKNDISLPAKFIQRMKARQKRQHAESNALIFPNSKGRPNLALIRTVRDVAKRAKIEGYIGLHKFRKTFGTMLAKQFGVATAQKLLGHASLKTTQAYLAADEMITPESRAKVEETWEGVGD